MPSVRLHTQEGNVLPSYSATRYLPMGAARRASYIHFVQATEPANRPVPSPPN